MTMLNCSRLLVLCGSVALVLLPPSMPHDPASSQLVWLSLLIYLPSGGTIPLSPATHLLLSLMTAVITNSVFTWPSQCSVLAFLFLASL